MGYSPHDILAALDVEKHESNRVRLACLEALIPAVLPPMSGQHARGHGRLILFFFGFGA
jgi:hypothetical protein